MVCEPAPNIRRDETYQSPIHYAAFNEKYKKKLSHDFERAFEKHIIPNQLFGSVIPLAIGDDVKIESDKESASSMIYSYAEKLASYRLLHNHTYSCISQMRRYRSNLQALFLVHPAAFIQVAVDQKQEYNC